MRRKGAPAPCRLHRLTNNGKHRHEKPRRRPDQRSGHHAKLRQNSLPSSPRNAARRNGRRDTWRHATRSASAQSNGVLSRNEIAVLSAPTFVEAGVDGLQRIGRIVDIRCIQIQHVFRDTRRTQADQFLAQGIRRLLEHQIAKMRRPGTRPAGNPGAPALRASGSCSNRGIGDCYFTSPQFSKAPRTACAMASAWALTRVASRPSTITRNSGSVPEARSRVRPLPSSAASADSIAA